jgi:integrase
MARVWKRAGIPEEYWRGRPHHAFRKGFISCLKREGADEEAVETLVGHSLDLRGKYLDPDFLPMLDAVAKVRALPREKRKAAVVVPIRKKAATG